MIFTPNEAAALTQLPLKRVYKELEYQVLLLSQMSLVFLFLL